MKWLLSLLTRDSSSRQPARRRLDCEALEARSLLSGTPINGAWFTANLQDPGVRGLARIDWTLSHAITRTEMLGICSEIERDGQVTGNELTDLRTLVNNAPALNIPGYVADLTEKIIDDNVADRQYQGQTLPQLAAGTSTADAVFTDLVNKWFLGTDRPDLSTTGAAAYQRASGTLFGAPGPKGTDVQQGNIADCYFLSCLGSTARNDPQAIRGMFINNGDGTYTVRLFNNGRADYVTVDSYLPESNGTFVCANYGGSLASSGNVLWVALAEKAYAQLAEEGWSRSYAGTGVYESNSYAALNYGEDVPTLKQLTGSNQTSSYTVGTSQATAARLIQDINAHKPLVAWTTTDANGYGAIGNHVYMVEGYNVVTRTFTLLNPYADGSTYPPDGQRVLHLTWQQFTQEYGGWDSVVP
jgi:hypothetical protein